MQLLDKKRVTSKQTLATSASLVCPRCHGSLSRVGQTLQCEIDTLTFSQRDGIWDFLLPHRRTHFNRFIRDYETIREKEGRFSPHPQFYQALPFSDLSGEFTENWRIRAISFTAFLNKIVKPMTEKSRRSLSILDLGAGNGWLSNRLAQKAHIVTAVDLCTNDFDGLAAARHYKTEFTKIRAEFEFLPFENNTHDLTVFNASIHYSESYDRTLREALRVTSTDGRIVILDSPVYHDTESGKQMVREKESFFSKEFGFPSNAIDSEHYLTFNRLDELAETLRLKWQFIKPDYGWKWRLKPVVARLRGRREPAKFIVLAAERL